MNKHITIALISSIVILNSCKKDYSCTCTATYNIEGVEPFTDVTTFKMENATKKQAAYACGQGKVTQVSEVSGTTVRECTLSK